MSKINTERVSTARGGGIGGRGGGLEKEEDEWETRSPLADGTKEEREGISRRWWEMRNEDRGLLER